jgi:hypothetical protein
MNRRDHREPIFRSNRDREIFLETLGQACEKTGMELRWAAEDAQEVELVEAGWCVGSETLRKELLAQMNAGPEHHGPEVRPQPWITSHPAANQKNLAQCSFRDGIVSRRPVLL